MNKAEKDSLIWNIRQLLHLEKDIEIISDESIIHLKVMGKPFCLYIKSLTYAGNPYPQNTTRAQLPKREEFETIKKDDSIFLFLGYDEANKVFACWDPVRTKERLNERQYVSFFSRLNLQQSVTRGNILSSTLQNDFKYVLFKLNDLANFLLHITEYFLNIKFEHATIAVSKNTNGILSKIEDDNSVKLLIDELISMNDDVSDLTLMSSCMNEFGDFYHKMTLKDWHHIVKTYRDKKKSHIFDIEEETDTTPFFAAEPIEDRYSSDDVAYNTINENEIEHVYVGVPSADPYIETEYEPISSNDNDVKDNVEIDPVVGSSAINDFFPLFGVTLGKTTWKDAENLGAEVEIYKKGPGRYTHIKEVAFWDHDGEGVFTSLYWTQDESDFPLLWKSRGFDWNLSYDAWMEAFRKLGYNITVKREPIHEKWQGRTVLSAEFETLSPDGKLSFYMNFDYGKDGCLTSSPKTLYSISVDYNVILSEESEDIEESVVDEKRNNTRKEEFKKASVPIVPEMLDKIFVNKVTSYKYFWFISIISLAKEKKTPTILYKDIIIRMAAMAWPIVFEYEIDLGKGDMISKYLYDILKKTTLIKNVSSKYVEEYLNTYYHSYGIGNILEPLLKNVPYRFLSPWIKYTTDEEVIEKSNSDDCACLYALRDNKIVLNEEWWEYIKKNYTKICNSSECSFVTYLKLNNNHSKLVKFMSKGWSIQ